MRELTHVVYRKEVHYLDKCLCQECAKERLRRNKVPSDSHLSIPVPAAYLFGFIQSRQSNGSLARELMLDKNSD